ncbi:MAG TPA: MFS transporter, partial [Ignavibacteriales bacterium]|nr:MFS transporter [Ignavibacteriales bacterium]
MPEVNINDWRVEDEIFWKKTGKKIAWRTLTITTFALILSFATWFMMSAIVVRLPQIGFKFGTMELFWLTAMPGLAGGTLRIIHTFLIPIFGTRNVITFSTVLKLIPCIGLGFAILNPQTPFWIFLLLSLSAGFGGGDFSSFMPSTSIFFPKRFQGTALGIQAGIGNFGVSLAQFVTPWVISFSLL